MIHSFVRNYLHITWSTKERVRVFVDHSKIRMKNFILEKVKEIETPVLSINIQPEHIHLRKNILSGKKIMDFFMIRAGLSRLWLWRDDSYRISPS